jgi:hypothetical protein
MPKLIAEIITILKNNSKINGMYSRQYTEKGRKLEKVT